MKTLILLTALLAGCETSAAWYWTHPDKQVVAVDGREVNVIPHGTGKFDAWGSGDGTSTSTPELKQRHIRAVEMVSKCKVTAAELNSASWVTQAVVACS